jgi:hypothetical protein
MPSVSRRRSQRILMSAPITVLGERPDRAPFQENTETVAVNSHGALVLLGAPVEVGQELKIRRDPMQEQVAARIVYLGGKQAGKKQVGIQFEKPSPQFWRIAFPPDDWHGT